MNNITLGMKRDTSDIKDLFRERRNQAQTSAKKVLIKKKQVQKQPQRAYMAKAIENYSSADILWYYRDKLTAKGIKYYSSQKLDMRYMRNIKIAQQTMDNEFILKMYDFLIDSGQKYLDMRKTNPDIIISGWANKIIADTQDWIDGTYNETPKNSKFKNREYEKVADEQSSIGEWE